MLPAPPGFPQLLVQWTSALQSVLTLTEERGGGEWGGLGHPTCTRAQTAFVWCAPLWSCTGSKEEPARGMEPECEAAAPHQPAFVCCLLCLQRGRRGCGWSWSFPSSPYLQLVRREWECGQPPLVSFVLQKGTARGI